MTVHSSDQNLTVVALAVPVVAPRKAYSDRLVRLCIDRGCTVTQSACHLPKEYASFSWSWPEADSFDSQSNRYVAVPYLDDCFDIVEIADEVVVKTIDVIRSDVNGMENDPIDVVEPVPNVHRETTIEMVVNVLHTHQTTHRVCHVEVGVYRDFMMTWSNDGVVQLWSKTDWMPVANIAALSPYANGVAIAVADPFRQ